MCMPLNSCRKADTAITSDNPVLTLKLIFGNPVSDLKVNIWQPCNTS